MTLVQKSYVNEHVRGCIVSERDDQLSYLCAITRIILRSANGTVDPTALLQLTITAEYGRLVNSRISHPRKVSLQKETNRKLKTERSYAFRKSLYGSVPGVIFTGCTILQRSHVSSESRNAEILPGSKHIQHGRSKVT